MNTVLALDDIEKSFGSVHALDGVSLRLGVGEVVALLGPNGAGKTTTIEILLGLLQPDRGGVALFGGDPSSAISQGDVGAMLQDGGLMSGVYVVELLAMLRAQYRDPISVQRAITLTGLEGLEGRRVDRLSGGQTQRLRAACALVGNPRLLVLDEPTEAMDVEARHGFWKSMRTLAEDGRTIVFSTHHLDEADGFADRVVVLGAGRVLADGPPSRIKASIGLREVCCSLPDADEHALAALPGVRAVSVFRHRTELRTADSDATLRALLAAYPGAHDIEVTGVGLEDAFLALTAA